MDLGLTGSAVGSFMNRVGSASLVLVNVESDVTLLHPVASPELACGIHDMLWMNLTLASGSFCAIRSSI